MSMTLILWKAPVVDEAEEAEALLEPFYDREDDSAFEPSPDITAFARKLKRLYPWRLLSNAETVARMTEEERRSYEPEVLKELRGVDGGEQFAGLPWYQTDRLMLIDIIWSASNELIDDIERLAREHGLVLYDPQGPDVHLPDDPIDTEPVPEPTLRDKLHVWAMALGFLAVTIAAWFIPWGWVRWPLVLIGGFLTISAFIVVYAMYEKDEKAT